MREFARFLSSFTNAFELETRWKFPQLEMEADPPYSVVGSMFHFPWHSAFFMYAPFLPPCEKGETWQRHLAIFHVAYLATKQLCLLMLTGGFERKPFCAPQSNTDGCPPEKIALVALENFIFSPRPESSGPIYKFSCPRCSQYISIFIGQKWNFCPWKQKILGATGSN